MNQEKLDYQSGKSFLRGFAIASVFLGLAIFFGLLIKMSYGYYSISSESPNMEVTGQFGDFIGGVVGSLFSLAGVIMLFYTLKEQREAFHNERMENRFFEMIRFHRENVSEMRFDKFSKGSKKPEGIEGKKIFKIIFEQIDECLKESADYFKNTSEKDILTSDYLTYLKRFDVYASRKISLVELAHINLSYLVVFFGLSKEGRIIISNALASRYKKEFYEQVLDYLQLKPILLSKHIHRWGKITKLNIVRKKTVVSKFYDYKRYIADGNKQALIDITREDADLDPYYYFKECKYFKYYGGHQFRLGHYFRHLFQAVNYINEEKLLTFDQKYNYVKMLRAQLSTYEQAIIFFNSLSFMGRIWELETKAEIEEQDEQTILNSQLITKYNFIKNLPGEYITGEISYSKYYPSVDYEQLGFGKKSTRPINVYW
jgi:hypothetical protein